MEFAQARDSEYPPYLLGFTGSPAERHVENIKVRLMRRKVWQLRRSQILREIGSLSYHKAVALITGPDYEWFKYLEGEIQQHFVGPDCYWMGHNIPDGVTSPFGNAWWIPFPPTLVIRYDDGPLAVLQRVSDLETYIKQNSSRRIQRKREIRMALRALDGQIVVWPYVHITVSRSLFVILYPQRYAYSLSVRIPCGAATDATKRTAQCLTIHVFYASSAAATSSGRACNLGVALV